MTTQPHHAENRRPAKLACQDSAGQAIVNLTTSAGTFRYIHLQTSAVQAAGITTGCGYAIPAGASHLHLEFPSLPFTLQGITFTTTGPNSGTYTSTNSATSTDTDGDGVVDSQDECPRIAGKPSQLGCPIRRGFEVSSPSGDFDGDGRSDIAELGNQAAGSTSKSSGPWDPHSPRMRGGSTWQVGTGIR